MADSDDEYDRKRRDKFRGERSSGENYRSDRRDERRIGISPMTNPRDDWQDRANPFRGGVMNRQRPEYRDYRPPRERFVSPCRDMPMVKRMRPDWGEEMRAAPRYGPYDPYIMHAWNEHYAASQSMHSVYGSAAGASVLSHHGPYMGRETTAVASMGSDIQTQPQMMSLKQFLDTQDDNISDAEVLRKYNDYKLEFKRQQLNEFFIAHKDEEWFKNKYHPSESAKRKEEHLQFLKKRIEVFSELYYSGYIKRFSVDTTQSDNLLRLLDTVVIKLEGGTNFDLKILDEKQNFFMSELSTTTASDTKKLNNSNNTDDDVVIITGNEKDTKEEADDLSRERGVFDEGENGKTTNTEDKNGVINLTDEDSSIPSKETGVEKETSSIAHLKPIKKKGSKRRRLSDMNSPSGSFSGSNSNSDSSSDQDDDDEDITSKYDLQSIKRENARDDISNDDLKDEQQTEDKFDKTEKDDKSEVGGIEEQSEKADQSTDILDVSVVSPEKREKKTTLLDDEKSEKDSSVQSTEDVETIDLDKVKDGPEPRALHRTSSIFLRNLAPSVTKGEIAAICKKFDGYLRVAIADPLAERRWYRRGWVTFRRDVNIKEICWSLNNTRLKDCEMGAIVNRDLSRRIRPVNGITAHKSIIRSDIKLCAKIVMNLDEKFNLWGEMNSEATKEVEPVSDPTDTTTKQNKPVNNLENKLVGESNSYGFTTNNPVLHNITDFLIEEASAEEDELLGISNDSNKISDGESIERDSQLISVLDSIILYLRIVHSVDFYNHCEYPYEDEMPNRCGIIHARGPPPSKVTQSDIQDYIKNFETKVQTFILKTLSVDEEELKNLGCKDAEVEVQKFIQANTQELEKDKWLCPLSGKKFKGPDFVRKHIMNKHVDKVKEVRKEVEFFNNYLKDPKRPQLPEHPGNTKRTSSESGGRAPFYAPAPYVPQSYGGYNQGMAMPPNRGGARGFPQHIRNRLGNEYRQIIQYRDLDAPQEPIDMFN